MKTILLPRCSILALLSGFWLLLFFALSPRLPDSFDPAANGRGLSLVVQADGKILVHAEFNRLAGQARHYLGWLNADGTLDNALGRRLEDACSGPSGAGAGFDSGLGWPCVCQGHEKKLKTNLDARRAGAVHARVNSLVERIFVSGRSVTGNFLPPCRHAVSAVRWDAGRLGGPGTRCVADYRSLCSEIYRRL